jgi:hypothetical protein
VPRLALRAGEGQTGLAIGPLALRTAKLSVVCHSAAGWKPAVSCGGQITLRTLSKSANSHGWGQPKRRTALGLGAEVKITSVSFGSALPAEDDATDVAKKMSQVALVANTSCTTEYCLL